MKMPSREIPGPPRDLVGYGRHVPRVRWPDDARVAVNFVIDMEEGSEVQMSADGRNEAILGEFPPLGLEGAYRDLALESVYEYGSRARSALQDCGIRAEPTDAERAVTAWLGGTRQEAAEQPAQAPCRTAGQGVEALELPPARHRRETGHSGKPARSANRSCPNACSSPANPAPAGDEET